MRKIFTTLLTVLAVGFGFTSCTDTLDDDSTFIVRFESFDAPEGNSKMTLNEGEYTRLTFDEGDFIKVNNVLYSIERNDSMQWVARRADGSSANVNKYNNGFYCVYPADYVTSTFTSGRYGYNMPESGSDLEPMLASFTKDKVITMKPTCALVVFSTTDAMYIADFDPVQVYAYGGKALYNKGFIYPNDNKLAASSYKAGYEIAARDAGDAYYFYLPIDNKSQKLKLNIGYRRHRLDTQKWYATVGGTFEQGKTYIFNLDDIPESNRHNE